MSTLSRTNERMLPCQWTADYRNKSCIASANNHLNEINIKDSKDLILLTQNVTDHNQTTSTRRLKEKLIDLEFWKMELHKQINLQTEEINLLAIQQKRLEMALMALEYPLCISSDNINIRLKRNCHDEVKDKVESALLCELNSIQHAIALVKRTICQVLDQQNHNKCKKENLELDWSDKVEAISFDAPAGRLHNGSTNKQFYPGAAIIDPCSIDPVKWAEKSQANINDAIKCRRDSEKLRKFINEVLKNVACDLRSKADEVERSLEVNITELNASKLLLTNSLKATVSAIKSQEKNILELREAIRAKDDPTRVVQTRLHLRSFRPGCELTCDPAQYQLLCEQTSLNDTLNALLAQLKAAEANLKNLHDTQKNLELELALKIDTIHLNSARVLRHRDWYPATLRLQGY
ncbi:Tektin [Cichlidogyrus casuarinus]|uniref:Tektin n=1 Tax=Cichlidogyrus casuarinus TaxID=1844966 RepID=A0ABD2PNF5_9PLAT